MRSSASASRSGVTANGGKNFVPGVSCEVINSWRVEDDMVVRYGASTIHLSHSPMTKSSEPRMAGMSDTMWPGSRREVMERLQNEGLRILRRYGTPPPLEWM